MKKILSLLFVCSLILCLMIPVSAAEYLDKSMFTVRVSSLYPESSVDYMIDGDAKTYWHSFYRAEGSTIVEKDKVPYYIYIELPAEEIISGFTYTPRIDNTNGTARSYNFYASIDGETAYLIDSGEGIQDKTPFTKDFGKSYRVKGIVFEITSSVNSYGTCAEFDLIRGSGSTTEIPKGSYVSMEGGSATLAPEDDPYYVKNPIERDGWEVSVNSVKETSPASLMTDGEKDTYWHSNYTNEGSKITGHDEPPFLITIELPASEYVSGLSYTPRQDQGTGRFLTYNVYAADSVDGEKYLVKSGDFMNSPANGTVDFGINIKAKVFVLEATATQGGYGTCAEINLSGKDEKYNSAESAEAFEEVMAEIRPYKVNTEGFIISDNSNWGETFKAVSAFDGKNNTVWHTNPDDKGKTFIITVDMGKEHSLKGFDYVPRNNDDSGFLFKFSVLGSVDGKNYFDLNGEMIEITQAEMDRKKTYHFDFPAIEDARFIKFEIHSSFLGHASIGELVLYETRDSFENANKKDTEKYVLAVGRKEITAEHNDEKTEITLDVAPYIDNGRTMIPLRGLLEAMGSTIEWQGDTRTIVVTKDVNVITLQIVNNLVYVYKYVSGEYKTVRYTLDVPPKIKDSRTFIPIRFVSEHLGYTVGWDGATQEITIENK